jgi:ketopantoate reductase
MKKDSIKITILGAGSIGSYLGGLMISSEAKVEMIGRESLAK